jgi:hypothetical protein
MAEVSRHVGDPAETRKAIGHLLKMLARSGHQIGGTPHAAARRRYRQTDTGTMWTC